jgi:hypothetical protein
LTDFLKGGYVIDKDFIVKAVTIDDNGCWLWNGRISPEGYGRISAKYVHRITYELWRGPIPEKKQIDHLCRVRPCVNPDHLEAVTQKENILRGTSPSAMHAKQTHCIHGHLLDESNTWTGRGRQCLTCARLRMRKRKAR